MLTNFSFISRGNIVGKQFECNCWHIGHFENKFWRFNWKLGKCEEFWRFNWKLGKCDLNSAYISWGNWMCYLNRYVNVRIADSLFRRFVCILFWYKENLTQRCGSPISFGECEKVLTASLFIATYNLFASVPLIQ